MAHESRSLKLEELARRAGVSPRTVRYYIQRGLLPAPEFKGADTSYTEAHLLGLRAIRKLQDAYWPLDAIASALSGKSEGELRGIVEREAPEVPERRAKAEPPRRVGPPMRQVRITRLSLAPGVELSIEDGAPDGSRQLVERIQDLVSGKGGASL